jgi:hypothetical protein
VSEPSVDHRGGQLVRALARAWGAIRARHPDVPEVVMVTGPGSSARSSEGLRLGHFAAGRWHPAPDAALAEVMIGGEGLERSAEQVLATLLHEAAHAVAQTRGIQDTSRQGRYHNQRFRAVATELGLAIERHPQIGWSLTTVQPHTAQLYKTVVDELGAALDCWRERERPVRGGAVRRGLVAAVCGCSRRIRVSRSVLDRGAITCALCSEPFQPASPESVEGAS